MTNDTSSSSPKRSPCSSAAISPDSRSVARSRPALVDHFDDKLADPLQGVGGRLHVVGGDEGGQTPHDGGDPRRLDPGIVGRQTEQIADGPVRQRSGQGADHVHPAVGRDLPQQLGHDSFHDRAAGLDGSRRERLGDQGALTGVRRRVEELDLVGDELHPGRGRSGMVAQILLVVPPQLAAAAFVAQQGHDVVVAGDHPKPEGAVMDRRFPAEAGVDGVRIAGVSRVPRIEVRIHHHRLGAHRAPTSRAIRVMKTSTIRSCMTPP